MVQENIKALPQKMKFNFGKWTKIVLSLRRNIHIVKMMTALVIYYILFHVPLNIPDS